MSQTSRNAMAKRVAPSKLVTQIFAQNDEIRATVEAQTIVNSDRPYYEPVLKGLQAVEYNAFDGAKVEPWLRGKLLAEVEDGPVISFRFGREYSPVLYLDVARAEKVGANDNRKLTPRERRQIALAIVAEAKATLEADEAHVESPGVIRLWWD
jgi:hypothetical protein